MVVGLIARLIQFDVDWAAFRGNGDSTRVEFAYSIPYDRLAYSSQNQMAVAEFAMAVDVRAVGGGYCESGTLQRRAALGSFPDRDSGMCMVVDQFSISVPQGQYVVALTVTDTAGSGSETLTVQTPVFSRYPDVSIPQVGSGILTDTVSGSYAVVPNPGRKFGTGVMDRAYVYVEAYNLLPDGGVWQSCCFLVSSRVLSDTPVRTLPVVKEKGGTSGATMLSISTTGLAPGPYHLVVEVTDMSSGGSVSRHVDIHVVERRRNDASPFRLDMTTVERRHYRQIEYVATPAELAYYRTLNDSGREAYLARFWKRRDLREFARRMEVADAKYRSARTAGVDTDRGRIYVKYGEPDVVEQRVHDIEAKPREYWQYYRSGYAFVFIDLGGDGNYRLVYANSPDEQHTGLEGHLTLEERERFR